MNRAAGRADLALLAAGLAVSTAGDAAALVALLLRLQPHGTGWVTGLLAAELLPFVLLAPVTGKVIDRVETRRVLLVALTGQAVLCVPLALIGTLWATLCLFAALSALSAFVRPATAALLPAITGEDGAVRGYAWLATGTNLGWIAGPAAGGLLTGAFGPTTAVLVDAATFALLALACTGLAVRRPPARTPAGAAATGRAGGFRILAGDAILRFAIPACAIAVACGVVDNVAAPFRFVDQLGASAAGYGVYLTLWGTGAMVGSQLLPYIGLRGHTALAVGNLVTGAGIAGIGLAPSLTAAFVASALGGAGNGLLNVAQNALISARTSPDRRGRAFAALGAVMQTAIGLGTAAATPLIALLDPDGALVAAGALTAVTATGALLLAGRQDLGKR
ncbi:MFS transporter [Dactylosporangium roseum]|uniref:MFS transporter n=1 Tax=Dactylosporangium roseum TaxID=47989 RepID=A0ABY5YVZ9_9ACTN|nr:MFS transporter [Dactylosporangium roseum]UWZ33909.1 MFS transporter [Dactylosporangium roseum]